MPSLKRLHSGFNLPTSLTVDHNGNLYIAESGLPVAGMPYGGKIWRITGNQRECMAEGLRPPVNGLSFHRNADGEALLYVAEGGNPGRISTINITSGQQKTVIDDLPGGGNYHTNLAIIGPDDWLYFGQGAATNSGIVDADTKLPAWLQQAPHPCDIPGVDIQLTGWNADTTRESANDTGKTTLTGAFQAYGTATQANQKLQGQLPCTAAIMRCRSDGSDLQLFAWGLRNPYGLVFHTDRLLAADIGINDRGSRPAGNVPDVIFAVQPDKWYGWPDFAAGKPLNHPDYQPQRGGHTPEFLLANHQALGEPQQPLHVLGKHVTPTSLTLTPDKQRLIIPLFGDKLPMSGPPGAKAGRCVMQLELATGRQRVLYAEGLHRPIDTAFSPDGQLYILDFGCYEMNASFGIEVKPADGVVYSAE